MCVGGGGGALYVGVPGGRTGVGVGGGGANTRANTAYSNSGPDPPPISRRRSLFRRASLPSGGGVLLLGLVVVLEPPRNAHRLHPKPVVAFADTLLGSEPQLLEVEVADQRGPLLQHPEGDAGVFLRKGADP